MTTDPVCKMNVEPERSAAKENFAGQEYYTSARIRVTRLLSLSQRDMQAVYNGRSLVLWRA